MQGEGAFEGGYKIEVEGIEQADTGVLDGTIEEYFSSAIQAGQEGCFHGAASLWNRSDEDGVIESLGSRLFGGEVIVGGDDRVERESVVDGTAHEPVIEEYFVELRIQAEGLLVILVEGIDPDESAGGIGLMLQRLMKMRSYFERTLRDQFAEGVINRQEGDGVNGGNMTVRIQSREGEGHVDVVRLATVAIKPWTVKEPRVMQIITKGNFFVARQCRDVGEVSDNFQSVISVHRGPGGIGRGEQIEAALVDFFQRRTIGGEVHGGGEVAATRGDGKFRTFFAKIFPELQNGRAVLASLPGEKLRAVENLTRDMPRVEGKAEAIRKPNIVKRHVGQKLLALTPEERAETGSLCNTIGKSRIEFGVAMQRGPATDPGAVAHGAAGSDFRMARVFEGRLGELGTGIKDGADGDRFSGEFRCTGSEMTHEPLQIAIRQRRRLLGVEPWPGRDTLALGIFRVFVRRISHANVPRPLNRVIEIAFVVENLAAIGGPKQERERFRFIDERLPLMKNGDQD